MTITQLSRTIKDLARQAGFLAAAIAPVDPAPYAQRLHAWLERGYCADMDSIRRDLSKRLHPAELVPDARSIICLAASYAPPASPEQRRGADADSDGLVARYARGQDYHDVLRRRCDALMDAIRAVEPSFTGRAFAAAAPVMARTLAAAAGLGWIGRNACLFVDGAGSYCVLAEIVCNLPLPPDSPIPARCGDCRACVAACPTGALTDDGLVDARRCISYLTIEHRGPIDPQLWPRMGVRLWGCDACQSACPLNRRLPAGDPDLTAAAPLGGATLADLLAWTEDRWQKATAGSAMHRATYDGFLRNAILAAGNTGDASLVPPLRALQTSAPQHAELVRWALARLSGASE